MCMCMYMCMYMSSTRFQAFAATESPRQIRLPMISQLAHDPNLKTHAPTRARYLVKGCGYMYGLTTKMKSVLRQVVPQL